MENTITSTKSRIHPLMAVAAVAVTLVSALGIAAVTGILPTSHGTVAPVAAVAPVAPVVTQEAARGASAPVVHHHSHPTYAAQQDTVRASAPDRNYHQARYEQNAPTYAQTPAPVPQAPVSQNSPVGIGIGAVVGGLVGNQIGGGNGKTLATVAGVLAGGYAGNEVAKRVGN